MFIPIQGCLMETDRETYTDFYRDRERQRYLKKLDEKFGLLSIEAFDSEDGNGEDYIPDTDEDIAELVANKIIFEKLHIKVRKKRKELSLSEEELAWRANISDRELRNIEHGKVNPKLDSVISLCVQLSIDIGELALIYPVEAIEYV